MISPYPVVLPLSILAVHLLDLAAVVSEDDAAAQLEADGHLVGGLGKRARQHNELLDLLPAGDVRQGRADALLQQAVDGRVTGQRLVVAVDTPSLGLKGGAEVAP